MCWQYVIGVTSMVLLYLLSLYFWLGVPLPLVALDKMDLVDMSNPKVFGVFQFY